MTARLSEILAFLLFIGFCTLFSGAELDLGPIELKPFDLICIALIPPLVLLTLPRIKHAFSTGFVLFLASMLLHALLAFKLSIDNGSRELQQVVLLALFGYVVASLRFRLKWSSIGLWFLWISLALIAYNILWHVSQGFWVGWKRLDEPKLLFTYSLPVLLFYGFLARKSPTASSYLLLVAIAVILLLSGERKAQLAFGIHLVVLTLIGRANIFPLAILGLLSLPILVFLVSGNEYLSNQLASVAAIFSPGDAGSISFSNQQRVFALQVSREMIAENPLLGIGTNGYGELVQDTYFFLPEYLTLSIHNEFQRVLVENGFIGLALYAIPWLRTGLFGAVVLRNEGRREFALFAMISVSLLIQCLLEGSGTEATLAFLFACLLPDLWSASAPFRDRYPGAEEDWRSR